MTSPAHLAKWHKNWNIIDSYHDAKGYTSNAAFKKCIRNLYSSDNKLKDFPTFLSTSIFIEDTISNPTDPIINPPGSLQAYFSGKGITHGIQDNNPHPEDFGLIAKKTISRIFDPASKSFTGFFTDTNMNGPYNINIPINGNISNPANFCNFSYEKKTGPNGFFFTVSYKGSTTETNKPGGGATTVLDTNRQTYTMFVTEDGYVDQSYTGVAPADKNHEYITGNKIKENYIKSITAQTSANMRIAAAYILCKLIGDLSHTWFCNPTDVICTSDIFLLKRCIVEEKNCLLSKCSAGVKKYHFFHSASTGPKFANARAELLNPTKYPEHLSGGSGKGKKGSVMGHADRGADIVEIVETVYDRFIDKSLSTIRASIPIINKSFHNITANIEQNITELENIANEFAKKHELYTELPERRVSAARIDGPRVVYANPGEHKKTLENRNKKAKDDDILTSMILLTMKKERERLEIVKRIHADHRDDTSERIAEEAKETLRIREIQRDEGVVLAEINIVCYDILAVTNMLLRTEFIKLEELKQSKRVSDTGETRETEIKEMEIRDSIQQAAKLESQIVYDEYEMFDIFEGIDDEAEAERGDVEGAVEGEGKTVWGGSGNDNNLIYMVEVIGIAIISLLQYNISSEERLKQDKWELIYDEKKIYKTTSILEDVDDKIYFLFSKYNIIIEKLKKFLINPTIRINEKDYHSETIIEYIQNYIKQFEKAIHNPQTKEIIKKKLYSLKNNYTLFNEELFKWVPSNLFFYSKDMNTSIYQIEEEYYTPLQIPKLFKYLDDGLVFEIFGIENTFFEHETFYELVIHELKINEPIESSIKLQRNYGFELLLYFLEIKYSLIMPMNDDDDDDTLITNYKNTNYLKNIKYFKKNGVSIENSIYFADLLNDVSNRNILNCNEIVFEILRELGGNDLYISYSFYNEYLPYFFIDVGYIYSIDLFYNIIQVFNNPVDSISIYKQIEYVTYEYKKKYLKYSLKCLCDEPGIKQIKNVDMLISLCVKNKNNIDNNYLTTFIYSLKLLPYKFIQENLTEIDRITETILKNVDSRKKTHISKKTLKHKLRNLSKKIEMIRKHSKTQTTRYINPTKRRINSITKRRINSRTKRRINSRTKRRINSKGRINSRTQKHLPNLPIIYGHG
jgi:hypothetical protein